MNQPHMQAPPQQIPQRPMQPQQAPVQQDTEKQLVAYLQGLEQEIQHLTQRVDALEKGQSSQGTKGGQGGLSNALSQEFLMARTQEAEARANALQGK